MCKGLGNETRGDIEHTPNQDYSGQPENPARQLLARAADEPMAAPTIERHRHRNHADRPLPSGPVLRLRTASSPPETSVFDYGCGRGTDILHLRQRQIPCAGWDPAYFPDNERAPADIVNLGYVVNVIENPAERSDALRRAWALTRTVLIVSARLSLEAAFANLTPPYRRGHYALGGRFRNSFEQQELREWIDAVLGASSVPAGPGIFYVFLDPQQRQSFAASRYRRQFTVPRQRLSAVLFEQHKAILEPLIEFLTARGRLPEDAELPETEAICQALGSPQTGPMASSGASPALTSGIPFGPSVSRMFSCMSPCHALRVARASANYPAIYSGMYARFSRPIAAPALWPTICCFPPATGLRSIRPAGAPLSEKLTRQALYVHESALPQLPPILRAFEGCARAYIGVVEGANIIKLHRDQPRVSYLSYPDFERDPHPALASSLLVPLQTFNIRSRTYRDSPNPPILHRKETFISTDHPLYEKFSRLTRQEEKKGLYEKPELIGTREGWQVALTAHGLRLAGHRLMRQAAR